MINVCYKYIFFATNVVFKVSGNVPKNCTGGSWNCSLFFGL